MTPKEQLAEENPEALFFDGFEDALVGVARRMGMVVAAYDYEKCIGILMERDGLTYSDAVEMFEFNTVSAWMGEHTPVIIEKLREQPR
jgi:hypothetical protein